MQTYKAILRGDRLEWRDSPPASLTSEQAIAVQVTILDEEATLEKNDNPGPRMAALLEQLANIDTFADMGDPQAWQREVRQDRSLPDRQT
ncbi:MAG: hypothetical protein ABIV47_25295 [Roseiflexaceae bacterium]